MIEAVLKRAVGEGIGELLGAVGGAEAEVPLADGGGGVAVGCEEGGDGELGALAIRRFG